MKHYRVGGESGYFVLKMKSNTAWVEFTIRCGERTRSRTFDFMNGEAFDTRFLVSIMEDEGWSLYDIEPIGIRLLVTEDMPIIPNSTGRRGTKRGRRNEEPLIVHIYYQ